MKLFISTGNSRMEKHWNGREMELEEFAQRISTTIRTSETVEQYRKLSKSKQDGIKDVGGFVLGKLKGGRRKKDCVVFRSGLTLDTRKKGLVWEKIFLPEYAPESWKDRSILWNAVEEAEAIRELVERYSLNQEEAAAILGRSRSAVANSLRLLALSETMQKYIIDGKLSAGHARALMGIKDKVLQEKAALHVIEQQFSVRDTEQYVKKLITPKKPAAKKINLEFEAAERELGEALETKVQLKGNVKRGRIVIEYFSKEQLYALYDLLKQEK